MKWYYLHQQWKIQNKKEEGHRDKREGYNTVKSTYLWLDFIESSFAGMQDSPMFQMTPFLCII